MDNEIYGLNIFISVLNTDPESYAHASHRKTRRRSYYFTGKFIKQ